MRENSTPAPNATQTPFGFENCDKDFSKLPGLQSCRHWVSRMAKPLIFTISAAWDDEAGVWTGHCDDIPAAADAPTLDELLEKTSAMTLDLLPDNHPGVDPASVYLEILGKASHPGIRLY
jgi:Domain of unknown function (DUF1902)